MYCKRLRLRGKGVCPCRRLVRTGARGKAKRFRHGQAQRQAADRPRTLTISRIVRFRFFFKLLLRASSIICVGTLA